ncbi:alkylation response protein AidB-like acyl-CoA dehydrogenase [Micromonospora pisi]|uniref:Alkylation response protein AidB-like acyl-CoA dehydrogenase n=1 Tax=Micromonospora pisi TaxID=589240 RepID=A0A495JPR6_9ACTN|nr:acyl-CoA dehydrogenase family protein [Micromonospora pisi]RKR90625.1 alkylation response protein AidB-like acyl-CoA dehydrogenase [Micromonospora pisi]
MDEDAGRRVLTAVRELAPTIGDWAAEIDLARRLPPDLLAELVAAGCFRMFVPRSHGGYQVDALTGMTVLEELARADPSTGWTVMLGSEAPFLLALLGQDQFDKVYADRPDVIVAGGFNPQGQARAVDGGYQVTGRWAFASGCEHADWIFGNCVVLDENGVPRPGPVEGMPQTRGMLFPAAEVEIVDTWRVLGLRGTGSHDIVLASAFCPDTRTFDIFGGRPSVPAPHLVAPLVQFVLHLGAVAVGIAQGALDELTRLALGKQRLYASSSLADSLVFQLHLGRAETSVRAARALLRDLAAEFTASVATDPAAVPGFNPAAAGALAWVTEVAVAAVDTCYRAGGGGVARDSAPLQRRFRDIHTFSQHAAAAEGFLGTYGSALLGRPVAIGY